MQVFTNNSPGKITAMVGKAVARSADGKLRMVTVGDWIAQDEVIVTAQNGYVQLSFDDAPRRPADQLPYPGDRSTGGSAALTHPDAAPALADAAEAALRGTLRVDAVTEALNSAVATLAASASGAGGTLGASAAQIAATRSSIDHLAPLADAARLATAEDTALPISLTGRDLDGTITAVWVVKVPTGGVLYKADGVPIADRSELTPAEAQTLVFRPAPDFHGNPGPLQFLVVDASGKLSAVATVSINVASVNDAPIPGTVPLGPDDVAIEDASPNHLAGSHDYRYATAADTAVAGRVNATDVDLDPMRFSTATSPVHGSAVVAVDGSFVYTPGTAYTGADRFVVMVDDGHGGTATSTVFIDVGPHTAGPQGVFAWTLAEAPASQPAVGIGMRIDAADALDLNSLLQGPARHQAAHGLDLFPQAPAGSSLDLGLGPDWGQRLLGLGPLHDWLKPLPA